MAQRAYLKIDGKESEIHSFSYDLSRGMDSLNGEPTTMVSHCYLNITKSSKMDKGSMALWMSKPDEVKDGEIVLYNDEKKEKTMKTIKFEFGKIVNYFEWPTES